MCQASQLHPNDRRRVLRSLEVCKLCCCSRIREFKQVFELTGVRHSEMMEEEARKTAAGGLRFVCSVDMARNSFKAGTNHAFFGSTVMKQCFKNDWTLGSILCLKWVSDEGCTVVHDVR
eukprot:Selendium_serpulae@DN5624_c0_g1_i6.p1